MIKMGLLERLFKLRENNTTVRREFYTGTIMFLAVSYILAVNPEILSSTGMNRGGLFYVTAIAAFLGTLAVAFLANAPLALASAMGLNAFFAYSVVGIFSVISKFCPGNDNQCDPVASEICDGSRDRSVHYIDRI